MRLIAPAVLVAAGLGACGSEPGSVDAGQTDPGPVVTADGAGSPFAEEGDATPATDGDPGRLVRITVEPPADTELLGTVIVTLEDVSLADAPAVVISRVELPAAELQNRSNTVDVYLPLPLDGSVDVNAAVHVDVDESGTISMGDWISTTIVAVEATSTDVVVPIVAV